MNLYLMRHAIAADADENTSDRERPLTEKGRARLTIIAGNFKKLDLQFDLILTSPALRTRQTARVVADALGIKPKDVIETENLASPGSSEQLVQEILARGALENLLLVGHEPLLSELIGLFLAGDPSLNIEMKKAGLCKLSIQRLLHGRCATLEWFLTPAQLAAF